MKNYEHLVNKNRPGLDLISHYVNDLQALEIEKDGQQKSELQSLRVEIEKWNITVLKKSKNKEIDDIRATLIDQFTSIMTRVITVWQLIL